MFNLSYHHPYLGLLQTEGLAYPFHKAQHKRPKLEEVRGLKLRASLCCGGVSPGAMAGLWVGTLKGTG